MTGVHQTLAAGVSFPTVTSLGGQDININQVTYTVTSAALGSASSERIIVVALQTSGSGAATTFASVTIGGVSATLTARANSGGGAVAEEMWHAVVPTGTTGNIVAVGSTNSGNCIVQWWSILGAKSSTPASTNTSLVAGTTTSASVTGLQPGSVVIAVCASSGTTTATWTVLTEDTDIQATVSRSSSSAVGSRQNGTVTPVITASGSVNLRYVIAAWR